LRLPIGVVPAALVIASFIAVQGCSSTPPPTPKSVASDLPPVPAALRGLVGSEVQFRNVAPTLVAGYGVVVGVNGTGGQPFSDQLLASLERQLTLAGITSNNAALQGTPLEGKSANEILRDPNVAVVSVSAAIAPGLPEGTDFDVVVEAINATSLEGGQLWTTDLRLGSPAVFGQAQTTKIAEARGPIFVNPFTSESGAIGRVLGGGTVTSSLDIIMTLNTPSHQRARQIQSSINSRFPQASGDRSSTARGRNDSTIEIIVPEMFRREPTNFLSLLRHTQIDQSQPEAYARRYVETIKAEPAQADSMAWAIEALGPRALPVVRELYEYPELAPRRAGLRAGARLNDPRVARPLQELIKSSQGVVRSQAIELLALVDAGPTIDLYLRELLRSEDLLTRIAAYESLADRAEKARFLYLQRAVRESPDLRRGNTTAAQLNVIARTSLPAGTIQGVSREPIEGKFLLDRVPEGSPLIYITQQAVPRIVLFGSDEGLDFANAPNGVPVWNGRLMLGLDPVRPGSIKARFQRPSSPAITHSVPAKLSDLVSLLARQTSPSDPRPGLNLTYSEVVAALSQLEQAGATKAAFATERDRLQGLLLAAQESQSTLARPENDEDPTPVVVRQGSSIVKPGEIPEAEKPKIVPITPVLPK